jgi:hypothetical protein
LVERFYPEFEAAYEERYQERYGFWRPIIGTVVLKFLECGDLKHGFARVRCPKCREEFLVPYSCRVRCFCPSCHEKRALEKAGWVAEHICAEVPHRQLVFTIPKRLRLYFRFYKTEHNAVRRFPEPGDEELLAGPARNFQVFDPLDFQAEVTQHIPDAGEHLIRYYGWYSNKTRGQRAQRQPAATTGTAAPARQPTAREARKGWAALIKQVYE